MERPDIARVLFYPGDGTSVVLTIAYIADFPRLPGGDCAFCLGDPCAEHPAATRIRAYFDRNPQAETCPMCHGRAT